MSQHHRHRQIVELLLSRHDEITAGEIASEVGVSTRTIHRELSELETSLAAFGLTLHKKAGKGIQLQGEPEQLEALRRRLQGEEMLEYSVQERKLYVLCMLLTEDEPVKLFTLSHELHVSSPTITNDLNELEDVILKANLLLVRRRGYGVELTGTEANKRKLMNLLARHYLDESDLFGKHPPPPLSAEGKLLELIGKPYFSKVEAALWHAEEAGLSELEEEEYTHLLIGISTAITRMKQGKQVELQAEHASIRRSELLTRIIQELTEVIPVEFTTAEVAHIAWLLEPKEKAHPNQLLPAEELSYMEMIWKLIRDMEERVGIPFSEDRSLRDGLLRHLDSVIKRLRTKARIRNPLLGQIKRDYEELFAAVRQAVDEAITDISVPDEEIGYLVMHFGASIEKQKQFRRNVRAVLVCTSGIGTSNMLAVRLCNELPQVSIAGHASWFEAARIPESEYDLIISTVDLPLQDNQYIKVSPLLTKEEVERLRLFIQNVTLRKERDKGAPREGKEEDHLSSHKLHRIEKYTDEIGRIINQFAVYTLERNFAGLPDTLEAMCEYVKRAGTIEEVEPIVELLLQRERQSSQIIPDLGIGLFHIRSDKVKTPSFTLFRLQEDLKLHEPVSPGVRQLLLMLGPKELSKESLEVLSEISSYLINPEMIELLKTGDSTEIKQFLSEELAVFAENKK